MVDLQGQYTKIKSEILDSIEAVLDSSAFINGPEVKKFQHALEAYLNVKHVIPCANGTDALQIALMALGLKPGDEVITSNFTFIATVEVIYLLGLTPVLIDVNPDTYCMDVELLKNAITPKTKAIIPVHLFGQVANMDEIMNIAKSSQVFVIEDAAQALGAEYIFSDRSQAKAGTIGNIGCTSFFPSKNLGCYGDGGALFTNDDKLAEKMRMIANHGSKIKYYHSVLGVNSRLDSLQAAILNVKINYLNEYNLSRINAAKYYSEQLKDIKAIQIPIFDNTTTTHIFHQYTIKCIYVDRDALKDYLAENNIPTMVYYPVPFHLQEAFNYLPYKIGDFPVTEKLCKQVLSLPMHTELDMDQLAYIVAKIKEFVN